MLLSVQLEVGSHPLWDICIRLSLKLLPRVLQPLVAADERLPVHVVQPRRRTRWHKLLEPKWLRTSLLTTRIKQHTQRKDSGGLGGDSESDVARMYSGPGPSPDHSRRNGFRNGFWGRWGRPTRL